jgi:uncharacterized protein
MNCPVCREPLVVVERDSIELDWCPWCKGLWFDAGEIELLAERFEGVHGPDLASLAAVEIDEAVRPCPRCEVAMAKVGAGDSPRVVIDRCPRGHGMWLDHGELGTLLGQLGRGVAGGADHAVGFLGETFRAVVAEAGPGAPK